MNWIEREKQVIFQTYKRFPLFIARGHGVWVWDAGEKQYLDFLTGIAVNALGHCHPAISEAIAEQTKIISHTSNLYYTRPMIELAEKLVNLSGLGKVFYANSGAEANEAAIKLARKYNPGKFEIITFEQSFHGRTLTTVTATGQTRYQKGFDPLVPGFKYVPYDDISALEAAVSPQTAAVMIEPIQGEGGVIVPDAGYLKQVRELCDNNNLLLILDEVQTGCGRTGKFFCYEHYDFVPDVVTLAKAIGGGLPLGVCIASDKAASALTFGDHASTFGGNPVACAAALALLQTIKSEKLLENCTRMGEYALNQLHQRLKNSAVVKEIRGMGLMIGIELWEENAGEIVNECLEHGLLIGTAGPNVVRMLPPYIISKRHIDHACDILVRMINHSNPDNS